MMGYLRWLCPGASCLRQRDRPDLPPARRPLMRSISMKISDARLKNSPVECFFALAMAENPWIIINLYGSLKPSGRRPQKSSPVEFGPGKKRPTRQANFFANPKQWSALLFCCLANERKFWQLVMAKKNSTGELARRATTSPPERTTPPAYQPPLRRQRTRQTPSSAPSSSSGGLG